MYVFFLRIFSRQSSIFEDEERAKVMTIALSTQILTR